MITEFKIPRKECGGGGIHNKCPLYWFGIANGLKFDPDNHGPFYGNGSLHILPETAKRIWNNWDSTKNEATVVNIFKQIGITCEFID